MIFKRADKEKREKSGERIRKGIVGRLAAQYRVSESAIRHIRYKERWSWVKI